MKVLITDKINETAKQIIDEAAEGVILPTMSEDELCSVIGEYSALMVRSQTKVTAKVIEAAKNLKIIGRAGVGVDNIDLEAATKRGIIVVNSPDGNTNAAAEHTVALMLAMSRNIAKAAESTRQGKWERSKFTGHEVFGKTLGIIGFGKIGHHVAEAAKALGMKIVVSDPYTTKEVVEKFGAKYAESLDDLWPVADYITVHVPKTKETMHMINKAYITVMMRGDIKGRPFTFPIPTYNMTPDFPWEDDNTELLFEMTAKYGLPYFQNFINSVLKPGQIRSMCCRLQLDLRELLARGNGLFGSAEQTGSIGVVTINCARLGYIYKGDENGLYARIDELMDIARTSLEIKRKVIQRLIDGGLFPFTKRYLGTLRNHFSTIGVNGINEMIRNFTNDEHNIADAWGQDFAVKFLDYIRAKLVKIQEETGNMYNLEATPAESATTRFAREDKKRFKDIIQAGTKENPYYTNSSQLPVGYTDDPFEALDLQSTLQTKYTGGTVLHLYMGQRISSAKVCRDLVRRVLTNYRLPYITITPTFSICPKHGYISGEHKYCPICDEEKKAEKRLAASRKDVA